MGQLVQVEAPIAEENAKLPQSKGFTEPAGQ
jgi:hypothetical protein